MPTSPTPIKLPAIVAGHDEDLETDDNSDKDDDSSSDTTIAKIIQKKVPIRSTLTPATTAKLDARGRSNDNRFQPIVCVRKINEKDLYRKHYTNTNSPILLEKLTKGTSPTKNQQILATTSSSPPTNARTNCSPKSPKSPKISPRKLRKPRGRWYRER